MSKCVGIVGRLFGHKFHKFTDCGCRACNPGYCFRCGVRAGSA